MADLVAPLVSGFVLVLGACAAAEAGVAFLVRAPKDVDEAVS